ncbi:MAG: phage tail protein, partial [Armatimonadia bacterium]
LFAVIGTTFGVGNGTTTFNLPDLRAEFLRGLDQGRGVDTGRAMGSAQAFMTEAHTHTGAVNATTTGTVAGSGMWVANTVTAATSSFGGAETRPRNVAVPFIIKAYDAVLTGANPPPAVQTESTTARTLSLADRNTYIRCTNGSAVTITVPPESSVAFTVGTEIHVMQAGAGTVSFLAGSGVTINAVGLSISAQWRAATLKKVAADTWDLFGALT